MQDGLDGMGEGALGKNGGHGEKPLFAFWMAKLCGELREWDL